MNRVLGVNKESACYEDFGLIERVLDWLEREDGELEIMAGYGLCLAAATYFFARLVQTFIM